MPGITLNIRFVSAQTQSRREPIPIAVFLQHQAARGCAFIAGRTFSQTEQAPVAARGKKGQQGAASANFRGAEARVAVLKCNYETLSHIPHRTPRTPRDLLRRRTALSDHRPAARIGGQRHRPGNYRRGKGRAHRRAECAAADQAQALDEGHGGARGGRGGEAHGRWRGLSFLDVRRRGARTFHPRARGRPRGVSSEESSELEDAAQYRPARGHRARRRRGIVIHGARTQVAVFFQGDQPRALRLSLRDRAGRHARRERHVWPHPCRAEGRPAGGGPRVLRDAGGILHAGQIRRGGPAAVRHGEGRGRARELRRCSMARSARSSATRR